MKTRSTSLWCFAAITFSLLLSSSALAQIGQDTSTADNPHLRRAQQTPSPAKTAKMSDKDVQFISKAAAHNESEVAYGRMAERKAQSTEVKTVAIRLVADHTKMNNELVALAGKKEVKITLGTIKAENMPEQGFNKSYLEMVEKAHLEDIALYEKAAKNAIDADLRAWAAKMLPMLRSHLAIIRVALKSVK